jgi:arginase
VADAGADGVWLHIDADCLDDALVPAVDWRAEGGLSTGELVGLGRPSSSRERARRGDGRHYLHPGLDTDDLAAGRVLVDVIEDPPRLGGNPPNSRVAPASSVASG